MEEISTIIIIIIIIIIIVIIIIIIIIIIIKYAAYKQVQGLVEDTYVRLVNCRGGNFYRPQQRAGSSFENSTGQHIEKKNNETSSPYITWSNYPL